MTPNIIITIAILALTFALLIKSKLPPVFIFVGALTLTITFRLAPLKESLKGFSNPGMLTVGVLLIVAAGMYRTGAITLIAEKLIGRPKNELDAQIRILPPVAIGSAFLNNTPLVAMFIPVIRDIAKTCRLAAGRLYIPLSYASILGGTCTLIGTSTNLVVAGMVISLLRNKTPDTPPLESIGMFDLTFVGLPATIAGIIFMMLASRFLLPGKKESISVSEYKRLYGTEFIVADDAPVIGKTLAEMGYTQPVGFELLEIKRHKTSMTDLTADLKLQAGDILVFSAGVEAIPDLWGTKGFEPIHGSRVAEISSERYTHRLVEVVVSEMSEAIGRKIKELPLPHDTVKAAIIAISRKGQPIAEPMSQVRVQTGDIALMEVDEAFFHDNLMEKELSAVRRITDARIKRYDRALEASLITVAMVVVVALGWMSMLNAALLAAGAMIMTGCISLHRAGRSVDFKTLTIIACAIGMESAVTGSGLSNMIADGLSKIGGNSPYAALIIVFVGCIIMDTLITNVASAVFMFPIAMAMAGNLGVNGMPFVITVMVGASCSFITPTGYQTNLMVSGPGKYRFTDYVKMGVPLTIIVGIINIIIAPIVWPF